jgi:hypothetical protein
MRNEAKTAGSVRARARGRPGPHPSNFGAFVKIKGGSDGAVKFEGTVPGTGQPFRYAIEFVLERTNEPTILPCPLVRLTTREVFQ